MLTGRHHPRRYWGRRRNAVLGAAVLHRYRDTLEVVVALHASGFLFCMLGLMSEAALVGGLIMLFTWQGDKLAIWYDASDPAVA